MQNSKCKLQNSKLKSSNAEDAEDAAKFKVQDAKAKFNSQRERCCNSQDTPSAVGATTA
jgi:hypothetical protein